MQKAKYFRLRNLAWELLLECEIKELPVNLYSIAYKKGWYIITEDEWIRNIKSEVELHRVDPDCFIIHKATDNAQRLRFGIAHEIGHIILKHKASEGEIEKEANMFASRLLMPAIVLDKLEVTTAEGISSLCNTSLESAQYRLERLTELRPTKVFNSPT